MVEKISFSVSPSSTGLYNSSQLQFYYTYILKESPDTQVPTAYGVAGQCLHKMAEDISSLTKEEIEKIDIPTMFEKYWSKYRVDFQTTVNRKPIKKAEYLKAAYNIKKLALEENAAPVHSELTLRVKDLEVSNEEFEIKVKGIVDRILQMSDGTKKIVDFKTSSSIEEGEQFRKQVAYYCYAYYKTYGEMITRCDIEYIKLGKTKSYTFTEDEVLEVELRIKLFINEIMLKGRDITKYSLGDLGGIFNGHAKKCMAEKLKREKLEQESVGITLGMVIEVGIKNNRLFFNNTLPDKVMKALDAKFKYQVSGYQYSPLYQKRLWDGYKRFYKRKSLPLAFKEQVESLIHDYNVHYNTKYTLHYNDFRDVSVLSYETKNAYRNDANLPQLRYYQEEAINIAIQKKIGLLYLSTSAGKTYIAAEIVKRTKKKTLYLINRLELVDQTAKEFEEYLGVKIGKMYEGELVVAEDIIVASVQTICAILDRMNDETKQLVSYLETVNVVIYDECHGVSNSKTYEEISCRIKNNEYCIGLTGTPQRNNNDTLEMNSLVGFVIYSKPANELIVEGFVCGVKSYFVENYVRVTGEYMDEYKEQIVHSEQRNLKIRQMVEGLREKKKILILTKLVEHAKLLGTLIPDSYVITGSTDRAERKENFEEFKINQSHVLIGSVKIFSTGINLPNLDVIINAACLKGENDVIQSIGRVMRNSPGKKLGYYIDFFDTSGYFLDAAQSRMESLDKYKYEYIQLRDVTQVVTDVLRA